MKYLFRTFGSLILMWPMMVIGGSLENHIADLTLTETSNRNPVSITTSVFPSEASVGEEVTVVVKVSIHPGWRIYRYVPPTAAYLPTKWLLDVSDGAQKSGGWQLPVPEYLSGHSDILVYQGEQVFTHQIILAEAAKDEVRFYAGLNYQACNDDMCLRPTTSKSELTVIVK